jgi:transcriptional regulator with XRE-family HTH domain
MDTQKLLNYMENLRIGRKMSQATYLFEIISQRQYYRYRSGESEIPFDILNKLANNLDIPLLKIISSFQAHAQAEKEIIFEIYNLVIRKRFSKANQLLKKHKNLLLLDKENKLFYYLSKVLLRFYQNQISNLEMVEILKVKIDYVNTMKKQILHDSELFILGVIMEYSDDDREIILNKVDQLRENNKLLLSGKVILNFQVFFWIIKNLGRSSSFDELLEIADIAIETSKKNYSYYSLEYFYFYKALAYFALNKEKEFDEALTNTIYTLFQTDKFKRENFFKTIEKDTEINAKEFIINKIREEFN